MINIGNDAVKAIEAMRGDSPHFEAMLQHIGQIVQLNMLSAMESAPDARVDQTSRARGAYDLWRAMTTAYTGLHVSQVKPPPAMSPARRRQLETELSHG